MKKRIAEELPARKHKQSSASENSETSANNVKSDDKGKDGTDKVTQAVYDIRYRARREELPLQSAFSQYMSNSSMGQDDRSQVKAKLFGEGYGIEDFAVGSVSKALYSVFVEGKNVKESTDKEIVDSIREEQIIGKTGERKYKIRVTGDDGRSYVRYATREKINDLRANSNIKSVEMTDYGTPYEGEKKRGEQTAKAKAGKGLDPVGKEDADVDNDGDHDKSDKYLLNRRKKTGEAIASRNEEFIGEVMENESEEEDDDDDNEKEKIDVMKKGKKNKVKVCPSDNNVMSDYKPYGSILSEKSLSKSQQRFMGMVYAAKKGEGASSPEVAKAAAGMSEKEAKKYASTKHEGLPEKKESCEKECDSDDRRGDYAKKNVVKNKLRAGLGIKNPLILSVSKEELDMGEERNPEIEAKFKRAGTPHLMDKFRQEHPGSRQEPKKPGEKETPAQRRDRLISRQVDRAVKHGLTKKERGESKAREKYDSARD